jgi:hypothetical protein
VQYYTTIIILKYDNYLLISYIFNIQVLIQIYYFKFLSMCKFAHDRKIDGTHFSNSHVLNMTIWVIYINHKKSSQPIVTCIIPSIY